MNGDEVLDLVEEFYTDEVVETEQVQSESKAKVKPKYNQGGKGAGYSARIAAECKNYWVIKEVTSILK